MKGANLRRQFLAEHGQFLPCWRANVRRKVFDRGPQPQWNEENESWKLGRGEPGKAAAVVNPTEGQAPVTIKTVPAQVGDLEKLTAHGLHWVPKE